MLIYMIIKQFGNTNGYDYIDVTIPIDHSLNNPLNLYYQCGTHSSMKGYFQVFT